MRVVAGEDRAVVAGQRHPGVRSAHLVVREDQVRATDLQVERRAEVFGGDRGALDVPAGAAGAEGGVPARFAGPGAQPDQGVERVLLTGAGRVAAVPGE